jgi:tRNA (mo5U34)-methyltransferase
MSGPTQAEVDSIDWWHTIKFPNGIASRGQQPADILARKADEVFRYPVEGKSVLDVGAWNGYFTAEATKRGGGDILAVDSPTWNAPGKGNGFLGFELMRRYLAPKARSLNTDVMNLSTELVGQFDVVLFLGVLYHLKHPLYVLERLAEITRERIVVDTHLDALNEARPAGIFYPTDELAGDLSNWWGLNVPCVESMLKVSGFRKVETIRIPDRENRAYFHAWK